MNTNTELIRLYARQLKLPTITCYEEIMRQAEDQGYGYEQFLQALLAGKIKQRQQNQQLRRIRAARFPVKKSPDDFDFRMLQHVEEALIWQVATGKFIDKMRTQLPSGIQVLETQYATSAAAWPSPRIWNSPAERSSFPTAC